MHDPRQPDMCFQGRDLPREGADDKSIPNELRLGDLCLAVGNLKDALAYYRTALTSTPQQDAEARLEIVLKTSACLRRQSKSEDALALIEGLSQTFGGRELRDLLAERATLLCLLGRYGEAESVCEEVRKEESRHERGKDAGIYLVLGHVLSRLCKWDQALVCLEQAATFARMCGDQNALGNALNNLGIVYKNLCRFDDSARALRRAVRVARRAGDDASLAVRLLNLATTLYKKGDLRASEAAVEECIKISTLLNISRTRSLASICKARLEKARGDLSEAKRILVGVAGEARSIDEPRVGHLADETLGEVLCEQGDPSGARQVLEQCLSAVRGQAKDIEAEVGSRLGEVYKALGMKGRAAQCLRGAVRVAEATGDLYEVGRSLRILATVDPDGEDSDRCLARAEEILRRIGAKVEYGLALAARASLSRTPGRTALTALEKAAVIFQSCGARTARAGTLCVLASAYADAGQCEKALAVLQEAEAVQGPSQYLKKELGAVRARIDDHLSHILVVPPCDRASSSLDVYRLLNARLGAVGLVLARREAGGALEVVKAHGVTAEVARSLVGIASARAPRPLVITGIRDSAMAAAASDVRSLLGVEFGDDSRRWLALVCWRSDGWPDARRPGMSSLVEACHELQTLGPILEKTCASETTGPLPICMGGILTRDKRLIDLLLSLPRVARTRASVLVTGETGTGKELVARAIHALSQRSRGPFVVQNCAALPEHLLESELFGHRAGAFTDARADKPGLLEAASGGTFFLDEIGDVPPAIQAKMLRAIESGDVRRLGETRPRAVDVRFVAATNKRLKEEVERGLFRRDLYYRLNVVSLVCPPLRERRGDVELLARLFLGRFARAAGKNAITLDDSAARMLGHHVWPGNVRELENEIERAVTMSGRRDRLSAADLSPAIVGARSDDSPQSLKDEMRSVERVRILAALERCNWNKTHTARALGDLSRPALVAKMKRLGIPLTKPAAAQG